jgi:hypothetical protein
VAEVRDWWIRTLLVLQRPRPVFVALRDESPKAVSDRAEPVLAIVILAGMAWALSTTTAAHLMDDDAYDAVVVAIWAFIVGGIYGFVGYFAISGVLHRSVKALGSHGSYRRTRHVLAFAAVPVVVSLAAWPVKLALYGEDAFRTGGSDSGVGADVFVVVEAAFLAWALVLLVVGVRAVHGWTWARAVAAVAVAAAACVSIVLAILVIADR